MDQSITSRFLTYMSQAQIMNERAWRFFWAGDFREADWHFKQEADYRADALKLANLMVPEEWHVASETLKGWRKS